MTDDHYRLPQFVNNVDDARGGILVLKQISTKALFEALYRFGSDLSGISAVGADVIKEMAAIVDVKIIPSHAQAPFGQDQPQCHWTTWSIVVP
jgi:hypothetical protein